MSPLDAAADKQSTSTIEADNAPAFVFQPQKLTEIVDMIDLMGSISERVREDNSGDTGGAGGGTAGATQGTGGAKTTSPRDIALANLPVPQVMQQKLIKHVKSEIHALEKQVGSLSHSNSKGSAFMLTELYKKIRRMHSMIDDMFRASADMVRRLYIAVFVDRQPLLLTSDQNR